MHVLISALALVVLPFAHACNQDLTAPIGTFTSPGYPNNYPDSKECVTKITAAKGKIIKLTFTAFELEGPTQCYFDFVQITDGSSVKKYCGTTMPPVYTSKGNAIEVKFKSDFATSFKGFSASYIMIDAPPPPPPATVNAANCGVTKVAQSRVIAGVNASRGAWPWQVGLYTYGTIFCGGSLIAPNWVLTAAHCLEGAKPSKLKVRVGDLDIQVHEGSEQEIAVEKVIPHPRYHVGQGKDGKCAYHRLNNDVGLLKLETPAILNDFVNTVCVPSQANNVAIGASCYISGWGKIKHPGDSHRFLQQALLPIVDTTVCQTKLDKMNWGMKLSQQMVCAGEEGSKKSGCHGDSGGPLVCMDKSTSRYILQGDVSWGSGACDTAHTFSVFGRVSEFRQWVDETLQAN